MGDWADDISEAWCFWGDDDDADLITCNRCKQEHLHWRETSCSFGVDGFFTASQSKGATVSRDQVFGER